MKPNLLLLLFLTVFTYTHAEPASLHYYASAEITPETGHISAIVTIRVNKQLTKGDVLNFTLNRGMSIDNFSASTKATYQLSKDSANPLQYAPTSVPLKLIIESDSSNSTEFTVHYSGTIEIEPESASACSKEWTELCLYSGWYPVSLDTDFFTYEATYKLPFGYKCVGNGKVETKKLITRVTNESPVRDMVVIASPNMHEKSVSSTTASATIFYTDSTPETVSDFKKSLKTILDTYSTWFGMPNRRHINLILTPRENGGGYARASMIAMPKISNVARLFQGLAHEFAHLYWYRANTTTWEDWLNEAFAEYSSILALQVNGMNEKATNMLKTYRNEALSLPPIMGIDRNDPRAHATLYHAGPILLDELKEQIGEEKFFNILCKFLNQSNYNTSTFLKVLATETSDEQAHLFQKQLKNGYKNR